MQTDALIIGLLGGAVRTSQVVYLACREADVQRPLTHCSPTY